jgi:cytoskeleton-associated protein 5
VLPRLVSEFGVASFDINALLDAAKQASNHVQKSIRDQALPIFVAIYAQTGSMLREHMLNGLKPATAQALEAELATLPATPAPFVPTRVVRGQNSSSSSSSSSNKFVLDDVIPRTDISDKISETLLAKLNDEGWKMRKEAMEEVHAILAGASHRIGPKDGGLIEVLKLRLLDNNKTLAKDALALLGTLIADMGAPMVKSAPKILPALLTALGDQKPFVKAEAARALQAWLDLSGLQSVIKFLPKSLDASSAARKDVLETVLLARLPSGPTKALDGPIVKFDLSDLVGPVLGLCVDKAADVRALAEKVLEYVVASVGFDTVVEATKSEKKATALQLMTSIEKFRYTTLASLQQNNAGAGAGASAAASAAPSIPAFTNLPSADEELVRPSTAPSRKTLAKKPVAATAASGSMTSREPASVAAAAAPFGGDDAAAEKKKAILKRSRMSTLPKRPAAASSAAAAVASVEPVAEDSSSDSAASTLLKKVDLNQKRLRVAKDSKRVRGLFREMSKDEVEELEQQLWTLASDELHGQLFSAEFQRQVAALELIERQLTSGGNVGYEAVLSISDLLFRWCSWRLLDANTTLLAAMLPFLQKLLGAFDARGYKLSDGEAANLFPALVEKAFGHNTARFRSDVRELLNQSAAIYAPAKLFAFLVPGFESKNKRVQSECVEYAGSMLIKYGLVQLCDSKKLVPQIGLMVGAQDPGVRNAALALSASCSN